MSRLIDIQPATRELPAELTVAVGDVLRISASGGHVTAGTAVRIVGIFIPAVVGIDGQVLSPAGSPNTVLFQAIAPGQAQIDVLTGDPWRAPVKHRTTVVVAP
ncbi:hypothetical protein WEI85_40600 [Actinomycetes bacterium KLBMP 9797]